jgi:DNA ligase-1
MTILQILNLIGSDRSKLFKEQTLKSNADNETLKRVFFLAYQPTINYFIKKIPAYKTRTGDSIFDDGYTTLDTALDILVTHIAGRKVTGGAAANLLAATLNGMTADDAEVLTRVVLRDLRVDCGANTANKIWKGLILDVPYQRCCLPKDADLKAFPWVDGVISQLKSDGSFTNVNHYEDGAVEFMTRNGNVYPNDELVDLISDIQAANKSRGYQIHGEMLVYKDGELMERAEGNGVLNKIAKGSKLPAGHVVKFVAWDTLPIREATPKNKYRVFYKTRLEMLNGFGFGGAVSVVDTRIVHSIREAYDHYQEQLALGLEGTILKHPEAIWEDTTSKFQVKFKLEVVVDLECVGFNAGRGKNADTFGSMMVRSRCGKLTTNISGFKDDVRKHISENREDYLNRIIATKSNAMTKVRKDGTRSLFLPVYIEARDDKLEADSLDEVINQFENAVKNFEMLIAA